jgi:hypothetical protein
MMKPLELGMLKFVRNYRPYVWNLYEIFVYVNSQKHDDGTEPTGFVSTV